MNYTGAIFPLNIWPLSQMVPPQVRPHHPEIIVSLGYGVTGGPNPQLSRATAQSMRLAVEWANKFPSAIIMFGNSSHTLHDGGKREEELKFQLLDILRFPRSRVVSVGPIDNSISEMRAVGDEMIHRLKVADWWPEEILLITVAVHHAADVWRRDPNINSVGRLSLQYVDDPGYQRDHILKNQQSGFRWLLANVMRTVAVISPLPLEWLAKRGVHKTA